MTFKVHEKIIDAEKPSGPRSGDDDGDSIKAFERLEDLMGIDDMAKFLDEVMTISLSELAFDWHHLCVVLWRSKEKGLVDLGDIIQRAITGKVHEKAEFIERLRSGEMTVCEYSHGVTGFRGWDTLIKDSGMTGVVAEAASKCVIRRHGESALNLVIPPDDERLVNPMVPSIHEHLCKFFGRDIHIELGTLEVFEDKDSEQGSMVH